MKQLLFCFTLLIAFASCTKSSTKAVETNEILRSGKWRMTAFTAKFETAPGIDSVYDIYKKMDTCRFDDYLTFNEDYTGTQFSAKDKCAGELDEMPFQWQLKDNQKILVLNNAQYTIGNSDKLPVTPIGKEYVEATITRINKKSMTLNYSTTVQMFIPSPIPENPGTLKEVTFFFTQVFDK